MNDKRKLIAYLFTLSLLTGLVVAPVVQRAGGSLRHPEQTKQGGLPSRLPIFRLARPNVNEGTLKELARSFEVSGGMEQGAHGLSMKSGSRVVEADAASGGLWLADQSQLWNPNLKPQLPDEKRAQAIAADFLAKNKLAPAEQRPYTLAFTNIGGTRAAFFNPQDRTRNDRQLDIQVNYSARVNVPGLSESLPVVGGGNELNVTIGDAGKLIGFQGLVRQAEGVAVESPVIPKERADEQFKKLTAELKLRSYDSFLAYYSAPPGVEQQFLYPVWVYRASADIGGKSVLLRNLFIPATEFGPKPPQQPRPRTRTKDDYPQRRSTMKGDEEGSGGSPNERPGITPVKPNITPIKPSGGAVKPLGNSFMPAAPAAPLQDGRFEGGTSWIGLSGGLSGSQANAQGFVDGLSADGWAVNFNWGDASAWESDWRVNDDSWVDAADFVFYTGHADMNGWQLRTPDDGGLDTGEVGGGPQSPGDMWGGQDLEWVIVAACGPLQDEAISPGGGDVFARWDGAFDGLHQLLGYGAVTSDNTEEGRRVVQYTRAGDTIINAWFRTAREIQGSTNGWPAPDGPTIWVGVMYVGRPGVDPFNDHIWGHGSVSSDPTSPTFYVAMWTTT